MASSHCTQPGSIVWMPNHPSTIGATSGTDSAAEIATGHGPDQKSARSSPAGAAASSAGTSVAA
ncbi:hypothetical protein D3C87_1365920 [compost metagenome]